jgi:hypothetical protein
MEKLTALAVEKTVAKLAKGIELGQGVHEVDEVVTLRITGTVDKRADETFTPTADIPLKAALALVLEKSGVTRDAAARILVEAMTEALESGKDASEEIKGRLNDIDTAMDRVRDAASALPSKTRKGKTLVKCEVEVLEEAIA